MNSPIFTVIVPFLLSVVCRSFAFESKNSSKWKKEQAAQAGSGLNMYGSIHANVRGVGNVLIPARGGYLIRYNSMKQLFISRRAKAIVDMAMILAFIIAWLCSNPHLAAIARWQSSHCITGIVWLLLITVHIIQHWPFMKALRKKKVFLKNKITAFTAISFILMAVSILLFATGVHIPSLRFHHIAGHFFQIILLIHIIDKFRKFITLLTNK